MIKSKLKYCDVSVIIPFYKNKDFLIRALQSVEQQTILPLETIIINDGSEEVIDDIKSSILNLKIINQDNMGAASARNEGIKKAKGKYIAFLDSDDIWHTKKLEIQISLMEKNKCEWSFHNYYTFKDESIIDSKNLNNICYKIFSIYPAIANSCPIATPSVIIKKDILQNNNFLFNEKLKYGEDTCLWMDLASKYDALVIDNKMCFVRLHGNNAKYDTLIQINARKDIWNFINSKKYLKDKINVFTKISYAFCIVLSNLFSNKVFLKFPKNITKYFSGFLFILPWLLFKLNFKIMYYKRK